MDFNYDPTVVRAHAVCVLSRGVQFGRRGYHCLTDEVVADGMLINDLSVDATGQVVFDNSEPASIFGSLSSAEAPDEKVTTTWSAASSDDSEKEVKDDQNHMKKPEQLGADAKANMKKNT